MTKSGIPDLVWRPFNLVFRFNLTTSGGDGGGDGSRTAERKTADSTDDNMAVHASGDGGGNANATTSGDDGSDAR
jgi:hypothetical protein